MTEHTAHLRPAPQPTRESEEYWAGALRNQLLVQWCEHCSRHQFYPRAFCTSCLSDELQWVKVSGRGTIYTFTISRIAPSPAFQSLLPYATAVVELNEGVRLLTNILEPDLSKIVIGAEVEVCFEPIRDDVCLPQFKLVE